ncbi:Uncharacterized protein dnm_089110 [Desulfonema magnum]|uniref:Uncharacterized protein n=1 Tax=Desulfonema magnum TaxID=45655 RepID=A0A975GU51_9BACT|nr:Uncharacterized protein dnm_089110 [Desulfonema magnum]
MKINLQHLEIIDCPNWVQEILMRMISIRYENLRLSKHIIFILK